MRKLIRYHAYLRGFHAIEARSLRANIQHHERLMSRCYQRHAEMNRKHRNLEAELERREQVIRDGFLHPGLHHDWRQRYRNNLRAREFFEHSIADSLTRVNKASDKFTRRVGFMEAHLRIKQGIRAAA